MIDVNVARALMGDSLAFHIIFALLGVGLPVVTLLVEALGIKHKDPYILGHAKRLSHLMLVLVIAGVASGTIIAIQMSVMWSGLVHFGGPILGLAFGWEGYAFMLESIFLAFYISSWGKITGWKHFLIGIPVAIGALGSALAITAANAWMQNPGALTVVDGVVQTANPLKDLTTRTALFMTVHSTLGYYLVSMLTVFAGYIVYRRRVRLSQEHANAVETILTRLAVTSLVLLAALGVVGHLQTQYLAQSQPHKFAALEAVEQTTARAPYIIGADIHEDGTVTGGLRIPNLLSILTGGSADTVVPGLQDIAPEDRPPGFINKLFELKMLLVSVLVILPAGFLLLRNTRDTGALGRLKALTNGYVMVLVAPISFIVVILGWMITEFGRQPYVVHGYLRTADAFSHVALASYWGYAFPLSYVLLFVLTYFAIRRTLHVHGHPRKSKELLKR